MPGLRIGVMQLTMEPLEDMLESMQQMQKMGPLGQVMSMIPGLGNLAGEAQAAVDRGELRRRYADQVDRGDSAGCAGQRIRSAADQGAAVPVRLHIGKRIRTGDPKVGSQIDYVMCSEPINRQAAPLDR